MHLEVKGNPWLLLMRGQKTPSTSLGSQPVREGAFLEAALGWGV